MVFLATAAVTLYAFLLQAGAFGEPPVDDIPYLGLLLSTVIIEVAVGVVALWYGLLGLRREGKTEPEEKKNGNLKSSESHAEGILDSKYWIEVVQKLNYNKYLLFVLSLLIPMVLFYIVSICFVALGYIDFSPTSLASKFIQPFLFSANAWLFISILLIPVTALFYFLIEFRYDGNAVGPLVMGSIVVSYFVAVLAIEISAYFLGSDFFNIGDQRRPVFAILGVAGVGSSGCIPWGIRQLISDQATQKNGNF